MNQTRPNIVFAFSDDWGRYASAYKDQNSINELIKTPNFDWVAEEGALFQNAHVPVPSCTPCRSSSSPDTRQTGRIVGALRR